MSMTWRLGRVGIGLTLSLLSACSSTGASPCAEPPCFLEPSTISITGPDGSGLPGTQATLSGSTATLACSGNGVCQFSGDFAQGSYVLHASAPGYGSVDVNITAAYSNPNEDCTCHFLQVTPSSVTLTPLPGP